MGDRYHAQLLYNNGAQVVNDKSRPEYLQHAYQQFTSACYADPTWATAFYQAGNNSSDLKHIHSSIACWRRAAECEMPDNGDTTDATRAKVFCNLGWRLETVGRTLEALDCTERAVKLDPNLAFAWLNLSIIQGRLGLTAKAVKSAKLAHALSPDDSTVELGLAFALLFNRELAEGFKHFESRYSYKLVNFNKYPYPKWLGEPDKTVFLVSDQGLGDTLSMCRFLRLACQRARYVHASVDPGLVRLLQYALADVNNLNIIPQPCNFPAADAWTTFVSLPFALGLSDDEIRSAPQIKADVPRTDARQWKVSDRKLHIGIAWRGSELNEINEHRSIPLQHFLELYRVPGVQLYSLQIDSSKQQMFDMGCAPVIKDLSGYVSDVASTVALLHDLDLVVTIESALGHICTLAGKDCWVPYSYLGRDYRVGVDGADQLWSNYRVFPQGPQMQWESVFDAIVKALQERSHD